MALIIKSGFNLFSTRLFLILIFIMMTSPISNHIIVRSAYFNGIQIKGDNEK
ncbi:monovalent cation/H(+) antiporter subunit G [Anaeromicrobium sediminis]|uniref:monovalent cation/H(+) antiporter subunit G n=1 Tax=Anaeromicrobium sediminis TaxID=1478221 RepID=UPI0038B7CE54